MPLERPNAAPQERRKIESVPVLTMSPETMARTREQLDEIIRDPDAYLDEGGAAHVYRLPSGICMKVLRPHIESGTSGLQRGNSLEQEAHFLERLTGFTVEGARSPSFLSAMRDAEFLALLMEEVEGVNLQRVMKGEAELPEAFSHHVFFESLERYLQALHTEKGIVHGDLEARNIMIDARTGMPRIIDFGRSVDSASLPDERRALLESGEWEKLNQLEQQVHAHGIGLTHK